MNSQTFTCIGGPYDGIEAAGCNLPDGHITGYPTFIGGIQQDALYRVEGDKMVFTGEYRETKLEKATKDWIQKYLTEEPEDL